MDADDLARGRALLERSRDTAGSWQEWQAAGNYWRDWLARHAVALLDAAERAARLEAALLEIAWEARECQVTRQPADLLGDIEALAIAVLERPKRAGDE